MAVSIGPCCTRLTAALQIEHPVMLAEMEWGFVPRWSRGQRGGGFGCLGASTMGGDQMRDEIAAVRATDKPFGVDLLTALHGLADKVDDVIRGGPPPSWPASACPATWWTSATRPAWWW